MRPIYHLGRVTPTNVSTDLLGAEVSFYSGKARAYLRYKNIPFVEVPATLRVYREEILPRVGWPVIPVVTTPDDETLQDTTEIIDELEKRFPVPAVYPVGARQRLVALLMELYGDEWLVLPAMHYRWNHCHDWVLSEFGRMSRPDLPPEKHFETGEKIAGPFRGSLPFLGVHDNTTPAIEQSYEALLEELDAHFSEHDFVLGARPSLADFGLFGPFYAHLYRDPYPGDFMRRNAPAVASWVERVRDGSPAAGEFLADDEVPVTLLPILARQAREQLPILLETVRQTKNWLASNEELEPPRVVGQQEFTLGHGSSTEVTSTRAVFPYCQWMLQRVTDHLDSLNDRDRASARELLEHVGMAELASLRIERRVARSHFRLVRDDRPENVVSESG